jgi:hypothetical protein
LPAEVDSLLYEAVIEGFEDDPSVVYVLDDDLRLAYCNKAWDEFAEHNGGTHLRRVEQLGNPSWMPSRSRSRRFTDLFSSDL